LILPNLSTSADSGLYLLMLDLNKARSIRAGRLPVQTFRPGTYVYVGRARKNLQARLSRHLRADKKTHWHIDYFAPHKRIRRVWVRPGCYDECGVVGYLRSEIPDTELPAPGFGTSDCRCRSHLVYLPRSGGLIDLLAKSPLYQEVYTNE
jgi:Uri superfamily endonuclease